MRLRLALAALALPAALVACQVIADLDRSDKADPVADAGAPDVVEAEAPRDPCEHASPPPPPARDDDAGGALGPFYIALREMRLAAKTDAGAYVGYDLDNVCTCDARPATAFDGGLSCNTKKAKEELCDEGDGVDNQLFRTLAQYTSFVPDIDQAANVNDLIARGTLGLLMAISEYNGERNDLQVRVGGILSDGILDGSGCGTTATPATNPQRYAPGWCGEDKWTAARISVLENTTVPVTQGEGYVNDGQLVFSTATIQVYFASVPLALRSVKVTGRLSKVGQYWRVDEGVLAGRVDVSELLKAAGVLRFGNAGGFLCQQANTWPLLRTSLCDSADLAAAPALDFKDVPCTSISLAFAFRGEQARVVPPGPEVNIVDPANPCRVENQDAAVYACP